MNLKKVGWRGGRGGGVLGGGVTREKADVEWCRRLVMSLERVVLKGVSRRL